MVALLLLLGATAAHAGCPGPTFEFVGQPACVALEFDDDRTQVTNTCEHTILIDQSVQGRSTTGLVPAHATTEIRDLSAFTLGMNGALYRVVATVAEPDACEDTGDRVGATDADTGVRELKPTPG